MSMTVPSDRKWNEETIKWWQEANPNVLTDIQKDAINFIIVLTKFKEYVASFNDYVNFWSNHPFDWEFIQHYYRSYGIRSPFDYNTFRDLDTYIVGLVGEENLKTFKPKPDKNKEHDALYDCILQIDWLFESIRNKG